MTTKTEKVVARKSGLSAAQKKLDAAQERFAGIHRHEIYDKGRWWWHDVRDAFVDGLVAGYNASNEMHKSKATKKEQK